MHNTFTERETHAPPNGCWLPVQPGGTIRTRSGRNMPKFPVDETARKLWRTHRAAVESSIGQVLVASRAPILNKLVDAGTGIALNRHDRSVFYFHNTDSITQRDFNGSIALK